MMMIKMVEQVHSHLPSPADFADCAHIGMTLFCSLHVPLPGYVYVMKPQLSEEKVTTRMKRKKAVLVRPAFLLTAPAAAVGTLVVLHFWDGDGQQEGRSEAWQERSVWCWSSQQCDQQEVEEKR